MGLFTKLFGQKQAAPAETSDSQLPMQRLMTSQLAALWLDTEREEYRAEYLRRLKMCDLSEENAEAMLQFETEILTRNPRPEMLREDFVSLPLITLDKPVLTEPLEFYKTHFVYPLSYVIRLSDEAEWHFWNSHERNLPDAVWNEIFAMCDKNRMLFLPIAMHLVEQCGWEVKSVNAFSYNEQGMLDRYRWGRSASAAAKQPWGMPIE